jgi:hypothetical protein
MTSPMFHVGPFHGHCQKTPRHFITISQVGVFIHKKPRICAFEFRSTPIKPNPMGCWGVVIMDHVAPKQFETMLNKFGVMFLII